MINILLGMTADMCNQLTSNYSIFFTRNRRVSLTELNDEDVEYADKAIHAVTNRKSIVAEWPL